MAFLGVLKGVPAAVVRIGESLERSRGEVCSVPPVKGVDVLASGVKGVKSLPRVKGGESILGGSNLFSGGDCVSGTSVAGGVGVSVNWKIVVCFEIGEARVILTLGVSEGRSCFRARGVRGCPPSAKGIVEVGSKDCNDAKLSGGGVVVPEVVGEACSLLGRGGTVDLCVLVVLHK